MCDSLDSQLVETAMARQVLLDYSMFIFVPYQLKGSKDVPRGVGGGGRPPLSMSSSPSLRGGGGKDPKLTKQRGKHVKKNDIND